jgi:Protein of unknown function (DUF2877)
MRSREKPAPMSFRVEIAGRAALAALRAGPAKVFASFERSCYVETSAGIACLGGAGLGLGPLNAIIDGFQLPAIGDVVSIDSSSALLWQPSVPALTKKVPEIEIPKSIEREAKAFLAWLENEGTPLDSLIGLGPGLTPAGDDFVGGAMIALRVFGDGGLADRIAAWALPLAKTKTNRISRAHLECAARGEGHAYFHDFLSSPTGENLQKLSRIGHTSGLDTAAGAVNALARAAACREIPTPVVGR